MDLFTLLKLHLQVLKDSGMGTREIARNAALSPGALHRLLTKSETCTLLVYERLMAISPKSKE